MRRPQSNNAVDREQAYDRESKKLIVTMIATVLCCALTMVTWHMGNGVAASAPQQPSYAARVMLVKNPHRVMDDNNVLWQSSLDGITAYDGVVELPDAPNTVYLMVTAMSTGNSAFQYLCRVSGGAACSTAEPSLPPGRSAQPVALAVTGHAPLALSFFTGLPKETIATASTGAELEQPFENDRVVYLTRDLHLETLTFTNRCPRVNLNGHRLTVGTMRVQADAGVYGTLILENGRLEIGGNVMCDNDFIASQGDGHITVTLRDLTVA